MTLSRFTKAVAAGLLLCTGTAALATNDGQARVNQLLGSDKEYREAWQHAVEQQERLPEWVINLSGSSNEQMAALEEDGDQYLVGTLCETEQSCKSQRLIVAFSWDKEDAYALMVNVPAGLPADKTPSRHADYRYIGKPDEGMQQLLMEQLKKDPAWY